MRYNMRVSVLRAVSGVTTGTGRTFSSPTCNIGNRLFSSSTVLWEEAKAPRGIPLALDLDGIHIPKPGEATRPSLATRLQSRKKGTDAVSDVVAPMLPVGGRRNNDMSQRDKTTPRTQVERTFSPTNRQDGQGQWRGQGQSQGQRRTDAGMQNRTRDDRGNIEKSLRPAGDSARRPDNSRGPMDARRPRSPQTSETREPAGSRVSSRPPHTRDQSRPQTQSSPNTRRPMLQKTQTPPSARPQRPLPQTGGRAGNRRPSQGRPSQPGQPQRRAGAQGKAKPKWPKRGTKSESNKFAGPTDPELNDYAGEPPVRKYDESGLLVLKGEHAQLNQPIRPLVPTFDTPKLRPCGLSSPVLAKASAQSSLTMLSYAERAIPEAAKEAAEVGLGVMDNAKLALSRVRALRAPEREKALQLVHGFVAQDKGGPGKVKATMKATV